MVNNMTSEELVRTLYIAAESQEESIALKCLLIMAAEKLLNWKIEYWQAARQRMIDEDTI